MHQVEDSGQRIYPHHICTASQLFLEPLGGHIKKKRHLKMITWKLQILVFVRTHNLSYHTCPVLYLTLNRLTYIFVEFNMEESQVNELERQMRTTGL